MGNVTHSTFGNHRGPPSRRGLEQYPTPPIAITELLDVETIAMSVLNPCGTERDAISIVLTERGHRVVCNDIAHGGVDFLTMKEAPRGVECAVMNAPFSLSADFVAHALDLGIPKVCVLQRLGWAECGTRHHQAEAGDGTAPRAVSASAAGTDLGVRDQASENAQARLGRQRGQRDIELRVVCFQRRPPWRSGLQLDLGRPRMIKPFGCLAHTTRLAR